MLLKEERGAKAGEGRIAWARERDRAKKRKKEKKGGRGEREGARKEHMDTGSLALSIHMPSHQMVEIGRAHV